jgi:hypothetical protein
MSQVGKLKYIADKWNVEIDGYSIPFPVLKDAKSYLTYIRLWEGGGEVISYDHSNKTLFWSKKDAPHAPVCRRHRGIHRYRQSTQFQPKATDSHSSL